MFLSPVLSSNILDNPTFEEHLQGLSHFPEEALALKQEAWERFQELPFPRAKDEKWRFSKPRSIEDFRLKDTTESHRTPESILAFQGIHDISPSDLILLNHTCAQEPVLSPSLREKGVIFCSLSKALSSYPDLLLPYIGKAGTSLGGDKYLALTLAYFQNGYCLIVPPGVKIEEPFVVYHLLQGQHTSAFPMSIVLGEASSCFQIREVFLSEDEGTTSFVSAYSLLKALAGSHMSKTLIQNLSPKSIFHHINRNFLAEKASFKGFHIALGSQYARSESHLKLMGKHCKGELYGIALPQNEEEVDERTLQVHGEPHSQSNLLYKNAILDDASSIFSGLIKVEPTGHHVDAYQKSRNLLLSEEAKAHSLPGLEILANEVKCSHGATCAEVDKEQLYYLMSRGLSKKDAEALLIISFFEEVLEQNEDAPAVLFIRKALKQKLKASLHA